MTEKFKVVISGLSGRFPECDDVDTFKEKLYNGDDDFITVDNRKWPVGFKHKRLGEKLVPDATGKFRNSDKYDQTVFRMNKVTSVSIDIINRKVLEPSFEAIVDAGINPYSLSGSNVSVFMSTSFNEVEVNMDNPNTPKNISYVLGTNKTMMSNRVSYALNLKGPSVTTNVDVTGGLNSLVLGYRYVSEGIVDAAVVGAASSIVDPRMSLQDFSYGLLCPDGVTRPFDEWANGYARSESVVCFYLQRAEDARRSYGEIIFCDSVCLGSHLPNFINYGESYIKACMQQLLDADRSNSRSDIAFVEMNAVGHKVLDKIESNVVAELIAKYRKEPLLVGSIRSNVGNVQAASGLIAVLKALLALDSGMLPPNLHLHKPNEDIQAFKRNQLEVVTEKRSLPGNTIAVNSFGLTGNVCLAILKQHEKVSKPEVKSNIDPCPRILIISGRQENDLEKKLTEIERSPCNADFIALVNDAFRQSMPVHTYRAFTLLPPPFKPVHCIKKRGDQNRPVWFIFSGMGSQWNGMGRSLLKLPLFAETVAKCDRVLREKNIDIYHILTSDDSTIFDNIVNAFVGIITVQIGLYEVVKTLGIKADGIIGHSVGENACAYADGCLTLEQAVLASWARGEASNEVKTIRGMMAAVGKGYSEMKDNLPDGIQVACHNSADSCTLTGPAELVNSYVQELKEKGIFARAVNVANIAYHSQYIAPIGPGLQRRLEQVIKEPRQRSSKWISTSVPEDGWGTSSAQYCSAEYFTNNLLSSVLFEEGCRKIPANAICIEFAPHGLLQAILKRSLPETCTSIPLTNRVKTEDNLHFLLSSIGMLYIAGLDPEVNNIYPAVHYPVPRGTPHVSSCCTWYHEENPVPYSLLSHFEETLTMARDLIPICVRDDSNYAYLKDHSLDGNIVIPPSLFMFLTWEMLSAEYLKGDLNSSTVVLERVRLNHDVTINMQDTKYVSVMVFHGSGNFQVILQDSEDSWDSGKVVLTGHIHLTSTDHVSTQPQLSSAQTCRFITKTQFHAGFEQAGYKLGEEFSLVEGVKCENREYAGEITWKGNWVTFLDALMKVHMFADNKENVENVVPSYIEKLEIMSTQYRALKNGTVLPYHIDTSTKELHCLGLVMRALQCEAHTRPEIRLHPFKFVPYPNPRCQDIPEFIHLCLLIATENVVASLSDDDRNVLTILDMTRKYRRVVELIKERFSLKSVTILDSMKEFVPNDCAHMLIISDGGEEIAEIDFVSVKNLFILTVSMSTSLPRERERWSQFIKLVYQSISGNEFTLLKRTEGVTAYSQDNCSTCPIKCVSFPVVIHRSIQIDDVSLLLNTNTHLLHKRYLYVLDESVEKEKLDQFVEKQMELDARILVVKNGELGAYRSLIQEKDPECQGETTTQMQLLSLLRAGPEFVDYVCFDGTQGVPGKEVFGFSYVADINSTEQQMGFATVSLTGDLLYDPYLRWIVQKSCGLSGEAATTLYTYALAYKLLVLVPSARSRCTTETAMINVGTDQSLAEAFIVLSQYKNLKIFVCVDSDEDAALIKDRFPDLPYDHILRSKNCSYVQIQRIMKGRGVDLIVNCHRGMESVETSLTCLAVNGVYIEVGTNNCQWSNDMGLFPFLKLISMYIMRKEVSDLLALPVDAKQMMQKFIEECIKREIIQPLELGVALPKSTKVKNVHLPPEIQNCSVPAIKYDRGRSYLILGTSLDDSSLFELIEWLLEQGAGNFMITVEELSVLPLNVDRMNRISAGADAHILFSSATELDNKIETVSLLEQMHEKLGPLEAAFFVGIKKAVNRISNLNDLVSPNVYFVGLASASLKEFEQRNSRGRPALLLHGDEPRNVMTALPLVNQLLAGNVNNNAEIVYQVVNAGPHDGRGMKFPRFSLRDYLPHNMEILSAIGQEDMMAESTFVEITSLSRRYKHCKGVYPIFALPAVHSSMLQPLLQRLIHPVFCATTTSGSSMKDVAEALYSSLTKIQRTGPISLISETWTLPLALELISYARRDRRHYKIFVLEGIPEIWSDRVQRLQSMSPEKFDMLCAEEIFHFIEKPKKCDSSVYVSFEHNTRVLAGKVSADRRTVENVVNGARRTRNMIAELTRLQFSNELLEHVIWFERFRPSERALKLSVTSELLVFDEPHYRCLLNHPEVSRAINRNAEYSWWEYTKPENVE